MKKETARMWLLLTTPSMFMLALPDFFGVTNIKENWTTFRIVFDSLTVFFFSWSVTALIYIGFKEKS